MTIILKLIIQKTSFYGLGNFCTSFQHFNRNEIFLKKKCTQIFFYYHRNSVAVNEKNFQQDVLLRKEKKNCIRLNSQLRNSHITKLRTGIQNIYSRSFPNPRLFEFSISFSLLSHEYLSPIFHKQCSNTIASCQFFLLNRSGISLKLQTRLRVTLNPFVINFYAPLRNTLFV